MPAPVFPWALEAPDDSDHPGWAIDMMLSDIAIAYRFDGDRIWFYSLRLLRNIVAI